MDASTSKIHTALENSSNDLVQSVAGLPDSATRIRPAEDRWSVLECIEHIVIVEGLITKRLVAAPLLPEPRMNPEAEDFLLLNVPLRKERFKSPEATAPQGKYSNLKEALDDFAELRKRTAALVDEKASDLRSLDMAHPVFGPQTGYEMLLLVSAHASRHANQIREIRDAFESKAGVPLGGQSSPQHSTN